MKKYKNLAEYYKVKKIGLLIFPITSVMLFIFAIIDMVEKPNDLSLGLILIGLAFLLIFLYIIILISINNYIKKLEKEETLKKEKLKEYENSEKMRDERIKELEEELKQSKNSKQ